MTARTVLLVVSSVAATGAAAAGISSLASGPAAAASPSAASQPPSSVSPLLTANFAALQNAPGSALPAQAATELSTNEASFGLDFAASSEAQLSPGVDAWLVPGSSGACLVHSFAGAAPGIYGITCVSAAAAAAGKLYAYDPGAPSRGGSTSPGPQSTTVVGTVPNATGATVSITTASGTHDQVPVVSNMYTWTGTGAPTAITVIASDGTASNVSWTNLQATGPSA